MMMNRRRYSVLVAVTIAIGGCSGSGATASPSTQASSSSAPGGSFESSAAPTPAATLDSTTVEMAQAPAGAIVIKMTVTDGNPRYQPPGITVQAGTAVFFLQNIPGVVGGPDHNMLIGPAFRQELARTPHIAANRSVAFTVNDLKPGTYAFWCSVVGLNNYDHAYYGMVGTLTVTP